MFNLEIDLHLILRHIYAWLISYDYFQVKQLTFSNDPLISKIRKKISETIGENSESILGKIGGPGVMVQIDETAICRGRIILNPSSYYDDDPETQWLVGGIEDNGTKRIFLCLVEDRTIESLYDCFCRYLLPGTIIVTDGWASYPRAAAMFGSVHHIVPHVHGFVNDDGYHTNLIENLWSHLKAEYKIRRGINVANMINFIFEFWWKKMKFVEKTHEGITNAFVMICDLLFNN